MCRSGKAVSHSSTRNVIIVALCLIPMRGTHVVAHEIVGQEVMRQRRVALVVGLL
jgi:hypothetical protein